MQLLTPKRLFSSPSVTGQPPQDLRFTPDNKFLTYRAPAADDRERFDLFRINLASAHRELWLDARMFGQLANDVSAMTAAERAERERRRDFSFGVTQYLWRPHSRELLLPQNGRALLLNTEHEGADSAPAESSLLEMWQPRLCTPENSRQTAFQFSPDGTRLAYVRANDLYMWKLDEDCEQRITDIGSDTISCGLADFLAAEEMHRFEGFWWSEDSNHLIYTRVDESPVEVSYRLEVDRAGARTIAQRYPYPGGPNPDVELWLVALDSGDHKCIWKADGDEAYLARVYPCGDGLMIQTQDRTQQHLLHKYQKLADPSPSGWQTLFTESAPTWVNLSDDFAPLDTAAGSGYVISEELDGHRKLRLVDQDGGSQRLPCPTHVNSLLCADGNLLYVTGWEQDPTQNQLYRIDLEDEHVAQITVGSGWHSVQLNSSATLCVDRFSSPETMLKISALDLQTGAATILHQEKPVDSHPYAPFMAAHSQPEFGELQTDDGQFLQYRLTPPSEIDGLHPVIVYVYGGPGAQKVRREWSPPMLQLFAHHGFGVLEVDNRGSSNRGRLFEAPLYQNMGTIEVSDQVMGLNALQQAPWADPSRVGIYGHSYGGYMTLMCLCQAGAQFKAGASVAPVCDWHLYDTHYTERFMNLPEHNAGGYEQGNVLTHLPKLERPLLLMHGMADDNVLLTHSTMIMDALQRLEKPFELMLYPGAKHSMQEPHNAIHRFTMILDFFKRQLAS